jgi:hypothetical protein
MKLSHRREFCSLCLDVTGLGEFALRRSPDLSCLSLLVKSSKHVELVSLAEVPEHED